MPASKLTKNISLAGIMYECEYVIKNNTPSIISILFKQNKKVTVLNPKLCHPTVLEKLTKECASP